MILTAWYTISRRARLWLDYLNPRRKFSWDGPPPWKIRFPSPDPSPVPMSQRDRKTVIWVLIGSIVFAIPAGFQLVQFGDDLGKTWGFHVVLTQVPFICATVLLVDAVVRRRPRPFISLEQGGVAPLRFTQADDRPSTIRIRTSSIANAVGGRADVRLWARITNPNPFDVSFTLLETTLLLGGRQAGCGDLPLTLAIGARRDKVVSIDLWFSHEELTLVPSAIGDTLGYRLLAAVQVQAEQFGRQMFRPRLLMFGELRVTSEV